MNAIEFVNVTKSFRLWHDRPHSIKSVLANLAAFKTQWGFKEQKVVLRDVSLTINKGEFVGFMGRNGVGKSTLLKLIAGIYSPSKGEIITRGRIAPLLELGAGFSNDLTGYENIFLNAAILGFSRAQVMEKIEQIIDFSELREVLDRPVRNYSSGMLVRLGFSIAAHLNAEILLFDEILAVGDVGYQAKCLKKILEMHREGRTIILVTHSPEQVEQFCQRCIVLDRDGILFDGDPRGGARSYRDLFGVQTNAQPSL